jgi:hypothetical protein
MPPDNGQDTTVFATVTNAMQSHQYSSRYNGEHAFEVEFRRNGWLHVRRQLSNSIEGKAEMSSFVTILTAAMVTFVELATANAQTLNILHDFAHNVLGYHPTTGVAIASDGALYGTIPFGGEDGEGIAYELVPPASPGGAWTEVVLHSFVGTDGRNNQPGGPPLVGPDGTLYGATTATVYQIKPPQGAGTHWRERVLYQFGSFDGDGELAAGTPVFGPDSAVYGTTASVTFRQACVTPDSPSC